MEELVEVREGQRGRKRRCVMAWVMVSGRREGGKGEWEARSGRRYRVM